MQPGVGAAAPQQFVVRPDLGDLAPFDHHQPVGAAERAQPVGDGDGGPPLDEVLQGQLDFPLGLRVDRGGGLVEDQDPRVDQQRPGDADPLPLAAGEELPPLADQRIVGVGQAEDELVGAGGAGGGDDLLPRGVRPAVGDVLGHRAVEQKRLLQDDADVAAVFLDGEGADVRAVDQDGPLGDVVEAADQVDDGGLARPAGADQPDHLAGGDVQVDRLQHGPAAVVEAHAAELDLPAEPAGMDRVDGLGDAGHAVEDGENPLGAGAGPLHGRHHAAHRVHAAVEAAMYCDEADQDAHARACSVMTCRMICHAPTPHTTSKPSDGQQADDRLEERPDGVHAVVGPQHAVVGGAEPLDLAVSPGRRP